MVFLGLDVGDAADVMAVPSDGTARDGSLGDDLGDVLGGDGPPCGDVLTFVLASRCCFSLIAACAFAVTSANRASSLSFSVMTTLEAFTAMEARAFSSSAAKPSCTACVGREQHGRGTTSAPHINVMRHV